MHHDVFDFFHFSNAWRPLTTFYEPFFIYGRLIYLFSVSPLHLFSFLVSQYWTIYLQGLSCILQVVPISRALRLFIISSSVTVLHFHQFVYYACSFLFLPRHSPIHFQFCTSQHHPPSFPSQSLRCHNLGRTLCFELLSHVTHTTLPPPMFNNHHD